MDGPPPPRSIAPPRLPVGESTSRGLGTLWRRVARPDQTVLRKVFSVAWPVVLTNLLQTTTLTVDLLFVGTLGAGALAATGVASQVLFLAMALGTGLATAATALVARAIGQGDTESANRGATTALLAALAIGIPTAVALFVFDESIVRMLGADDALVSNSSLVLRILAFGLPGELLILAAAGALQGAGDTRPALVIGLIVNAVNVALDYVLIFGKFGFPEMGLAGAAVATTASFLVGGMLFLILLRRGRRPVGLARAWTGTLDTMRRLARVGTPASAESLLLSLGFTAYLVLILHFGASALAAQQVGLRIQSFAFMPGFGFAAAASALVGQGLGRGVPADAERDGWTSIGLGFLVMVGVSAPIFFFAEPLAGVFIQEPQALRLSADWVRIIVITMPAIALHFTAAGALRGAGDTRWPLAVSFGGLWLVRLPVSWFLAFPMGWGMYGVWAGYVVEYYLRAAVMVWRYAQGKWKTLTV